MTSFSLHIFIKVSRSERGREGGRGKEGEGEEGGRGKEGWSAGVR